MIYSSLCRTFLEAMEPLMIATPDVREYHRSDFISVVDTVKPDAEVQSYEFYYEYVVAKCRSLECLWNE